MADAHTAATKYYGTEGSDTIAASTSGGTSHTAYGQDESRGGSTLSLTLTHRHRYHNHVRAPSGPIIHVHFINRSCLVYTMYSIRSRKFGSERITHQLALKGIQPNFLPQEPVLLVYVPSSYDPEP